MTERAGELESTAAAGPTFAEAVRVWFRIGILSFGGPAAQIALMHRVIVDEKQWMRERQFLRALSFCMLLPGPEAMQLATYSGWRLHGTPGGLAAGLLFVLPGAVVVLALAAIYAEFGQVPLVEAVFLGIKAAVLVIVLEALLRIGRRALSRAEHWLVALASFVAIFFFALPFPLIVAGAALYGALRAVPADGSEQRSAISVRVADSLRTGAIWLALWMGPLLALTYWPGDGGILGAIGWFFSKLAVVTFGGAYAVLAYMAQDVVIGFGWLEAGQMMDGLGLAETTPGPLILVTEFVGYLAAHAHGGGPGWATGLAGAAVTLWVTFVPCFLWIFVGAPYVEWITGQARLAGALAGITAAVVGVIANLAVWFALHVFFADVSEERLGILHLWTPDLASVDWRVAVLAAVSGALLLWRHWNIAAVLGIAAGASLIGSLIAG